MYIKSFASVAVLALVLPTTTVMAASHEKSSTARVDMSGVLPDAQPGQCFAQVVTPATYETVTEQVLVKPVSEEVSIVPTEFAEAETSIIEKEAFTKINVVPVKFREEIEEVQVAEARTEWVTSLDDKGIPASPALLAGAKTSGVSLESTEVGACYREYYNPAKYEETTKEVLVKEESEEIKIAEAQFEEAEETVVVKEATQKKVYNAAEYETVEEKIEIEAAKTVWKKSITSAGEVMSLVNIPAKYETISKRVLKNESSIDTVEVPEETKAIKVQKLVTDTTIDKIKIPAEYKTLTLNNKVADANFSWTSGSPADGGVFTGNQVCLRDVPAKFEQVTKLVVDEPAEIQEETVAAVSKLIKVSNVSQPAKQVRNLVQAEYKTVEKRVKLTEEFTEWRQVLCAVDNVPDINKRVQQALLDNNLYSGVIDGKIGRGTKAALSKYQKEKGLKIVDGSITLETLKQLGIK